MSKLEYSWGEFRRMMEEAGFHYDKLVGFWTWVVYHAISDDQLLKLAGVLTELAKGKDYE